MKRACLANGAEFITAIRHVLESGQFILAGRVEEFERAFAGYCGVPHGIGVASGTDALRLALLACGVGTGHAVITVANTCVPTISAICAVGARPVFVDVDPDTYTLDPALLESRITADVRAIMPVHLYGQCAEMDPILEIARRHGLRVIEDCAHAHGARYRGRMAGTMGDAGCYSFYPTKNLGAFGDAGMVVTNSAEIAQQIRRLRHQGQAQCDVHATAACHSRLDEVQAAVLLVKLPYLDGWNARRREIAGRYSEAFADGDLRCPRETPGRDHAYHLYVVRARDRAKFQTRLTERGIATLVHYPVPMHRQGGYARSVQDDTHLPVTEMLASEVVSLPLYPELDDDEIETVIDGASGTG